MKYKLIFTLILSVIVSTMKLDETVNNNETSEQTRLLLKGANKVLSAKNKSNSKKIQEFAQTVFNKVDVKREIYLPTTDREDKLVNKMKFIEIDVDHNKAPNKDDNVRNIKLLNLYHQRHAPSYKSPIIKKDKKLLAKIKSEPFTQLAMAVQKGTQYARHLHNYFNTQYTAKFAVGKKGEEFSFILDTGSGTTLLNDFRCESEGCKKRKRFNSQQSSSWKSYGKMVRINYARGGVVIELGQDNFYFGGLLISEQQFGVIIREMGLFSSASYDGIMGLSYPSLSEHTKPVFDRIIEMQKLERNMFSFYLGRGLADKSKFTIGGYNEKYIKGKLKWHPVIRKTWWTLKLDAVLLNGVDTNLCNDKTNCEVIMDTGSSLMATPPWALNPFLSKLRSFSNCHDIQKFPTITYVINGEKYSLEPYEYILSAGNTLRYDKRETSGVCGFGYSIFDVGKKNVWIAGDIFLTKYFSVYDRDHDRVGLALANHNHNH